LQKYWAKHRGATRWGVWITGGSKITGESKNEDLYLSDAGHLFVWADRIDIRDGDLVFANEEGVIQGVIARGEWGAVYEASDDADVPQAVETR
jgi:hypothetical protein